MNDRLLRRQDLNLRPSGYEPDELPTAPLREALPYQQESERFGGPEGMALAEEHFHLSTQVVLSRLNGPYTYGDALFDGLRMHLSTVFTAGMERPRAAWYFDQLCKQWIQAFFRPAEGDSAASLEAAVLKDFEGAFQNQKETLQDSAVQIWQALQKEKFDTDHPEWLRWHRGNQMILDQWEEGLDQALPNLIHLSNNRLGIKNHDEPYLNYILAKTL